LQKQTLHGALVRRRLQESEARDAEDEEHAMTTATVLDAATETYRSLRLSGKDSVAAARETLAAHPGLEFSDIGTVAHFGEPPRSAASKRAARRAADHLD
jgi:hypothetical protein